MRSFPGWIVAVVAGIADLPRALKRTHAPRIIISADEESFASALQEIEPSEPVSAVIITERNVDDLRIDIPYEIVRKPFSDDQLTGAVKTVLARQPSSP